MTTKQEIENESQQSLVSFRPDNPLTYCKSAKGEDTNGKFCNAW